VPRRDPGRTVETYTVDDPASQGPRTLVACTRIAPDGSVETLVASAYVEHRALLDLHLGTVQEVLSKRTVS
jgi:hypothetical protein